MNERWLADRLSGLHEMNAHFRRIYELSRSVPDPINLVVGQPDFDVPEPIKQAALSAIIAGHNSYAPTQGLVPLRNSMREGLQQRFPTAMNRDVVITGGTMAALNLALLATVNPGDEVILFDPCFMAYEPMIRLFGGQTVFVDTYPSFQIDPDRLAAALTDRTKAILICSPGNPTGVVQEPGRVRAVAELAERRGLVLISDEIYADFVYDENCVSPLAFNPQTVVVSSWSKTHALTGWRLGYAHGPARLIEAMTQVQMVTFVAGPSFAQHAVQNAGPVDLTPHLREYQRKRDWLLRDLAEHFTIVKPGGAFYLFMPTPWGSGSTFVEEAIRHKLMILPGCVFGRHDTHIRLSYAVADQTLERGIEVLRQLAQQPPPASA